MHPVDKGVGMYMGVVLIAVLGRWRESGVLDQTIKEEMLFWEVSKWI